jgi:hypothetical protein
MGKDTYASGNYSIAVGNAASTYGIGAVAFGSTTRGSALNSVAMGNQSNADGISSVAIGNLSQAQGNYSTALGDSVTVTGTDSFGIGLDATARTVSANNVMSVMGGNVGIGTTSPAATLDIEGYMRLKKNTGAPAVCSAANDGAMALTSTYRTCVCSGGISTWVYTSDGTTSCVWQ